MGNSRNPGRNSILMNKQSIAISLGLNCDIMLRIALLHGILRHSILPSGLWHSVFASVGSIPIPLSPGHQKVKPVGSVQSRSLH